ncbi:MAG: hypothetical protein ACJ784_02930 [Myxococcales bacterium]
MLLSFAGAAASGAAYVQSSAPVSPALPWSLTERLAALRINRGLPKAIRKQATLSLRGDHAVLKVREATGPVLLKCPLRAGLDVGDAYLSYVTSGTPPGCETQAVDEVGDVLVYEVSGHVAPLCPGQYATLTEEQLHHALFLPALQLSRPAGDGDPAPAVLQPGRLEACTGGANCALTKAAGALLYCGVVRTCAEGACFQGQTADVKPDDVAASLYYAQALAQASAPASVAPAACGAVPMSVHLTTLVSEAVTATTAAKFVEAQPWNAPGLVAPGSADTASDLRSFFDRTPRGICLFIRGIDVDRPREAEMAAQSLAFPVFAPFDPRASGRASPLLRSLQRAAFDQDGMASLFSRCDLSSPEACKQKRDRMAAQLRASVGTLKPALTNLAADEIPYHIGASGPFHLADFDTLHLTLESSAPVPKANGSRSNLMVRYQPLWPESVAEKKLSCAQQPGICLFRALWNVHGPSAQASPPASLTDEGGFESLVALFARRDANTRCVRRLFNALASESDDRLLELQRDLREPLSAGENRAPCDPRARSSIGLVPRPGEGTSGACPEKLSAKPFGDTGSAPCRPLSLVYVQEEPWAQAAVRIASIARRRDIDVSVSGIKAAEVHRGSLASWDVLLTVASNYYNRKYPTLVPLLHPAGNQNLSGGQGVSESPGRLLLATYEASIVYPPPAWLGVAGEVPKTRAESLQKLEEDVARNGPAPIYPLAFLRPATVTIPASQVDSARDAWYFERLLSAWTAQPAWSAQP